jgi:hypothetical protein
MIIEEPFKDRYDMGFFAGFRQAEKALYTIEDIRRAIDFDKFNYEYGNTVGLKSEEITVVCSGLKCFGPRDP